MPNIFRASMFCLMVLILTVWMTESAAAQASQITMSCTTPAPESHTSNGCRSTELAPPPGGTPPIIVGDKLLFVGGFWVWCQSPNGGTPYGPDCNGAVYVEEVNLTTNAGKYQATSISGSSSASGPTGLQVSFTSSDGDMACIFNVPTDPTSGGSNTIRGFCDGVPITFSNVVVNVTK